MPTALTKPPPSGVISGKKALEVENAELRAAFAGIGATERELLRADVDRLRTEQAAARAELQRLQHQVAVTTEIAMLQEVGIYSYRHPLDTSVAHKDRLDQLRTQIKAMSRDGHAITAAQTWYVNNSEKEGTRMVKDISKLMLRAYNNEADNLVRSMKPYKLDNAIDRLAKTRATISKLGKTMSIEVTVAFHQLRIRELELTADFLAKQAEEREREREERARLREEEQARREYEREKERLLKEAAHYQAALEAMRANGDEAGIAEAEAKLAEIGAAIDGVEERSANTRAGYVYVISNLGSFGERMVKIGMTRRLEPMDRVRELGDASVPFTYDVHALIFSDDAVGLETKLHQMFSPQRVNLVNMRREFFYVTPADVRDALARIEAASLLSYEELPEALEWHQSENARKTTSG